MGDEGLAKEFRKKAKCYGHKMHEYLFDESQGLFADYLGMQWIPVEVDGKWYEPISWREDLACGPEFLSPLGKLAQCTQPYRGEPDWDYKRCCRDGKCMEDLACSCAGCEPHHSIDDDWTQVLQNSYSIHRGIVQFWPLFFEQVPQTDRIKSSLDHLASDLLSPYGVRSLSVRD